MPNKSIIQRLVYLNAASAVAVSGIERPKLIAELEPNAWTRSADGKKLYPLFTEEAARQYGEHVRAIRARRKSNPTRVSVPADAAVV